MRSTRKLAVLLCAVTLPFVAPIALLGQEQAPAPDLRLVIEPEHPQDSLGEAIYVLLLPKEHHEHDDDCYEIGKYENLPTVPGVVTAPVASGKPPKFPKSLKKTKTPSQVSVCGVVSIAGEFIDSSVRPDTPSDIARDALVAVAKYHLKPATLDSKPIAVRMRLEFKRVVR